MKPGHDVHLVKPHLCPHCGALLNAFGSLDGKRTRKPHPGDFTFCIACATPYVVGDTLALRPPTEPELHDFKRQDPETMKAWMRARMQAALLRHLRPSRPGPAGHA